MPTVQLRVESVTRTVQSESVQLNVMFLSESQSTVVGNAYFTVSSPDNFGEFNPGDTFDLSRSATSPSMAESPSVGTDTDNATPTDGGNGAVNPAPPADIARTSTD